MANYGSVSMILIHYNPSEDSRYEVVVKNKTSKNIVFVKTGRGLKQVGEMKLFPNNVPVDFLVF